MIRLANNKDIEKINELGKIIDLDFSKKYNIYDYLKNDKYLIIVNEDEIINGLLVVYKNIDYFELEIIVVDNNYQNQGIATNLLNYLYDNYLNNKDILLEVSVNNKNAINLYKKNDFEIINTRKKYYNGVDAYVMKRVVK